jgi:hypothetical protein
MMVSFSVLMELWESATPVWMDSSLVVGCLSLCPSCHDNKQHNKEGHGHCRFYVKFMSRSVALVAVLAALFPDRPVLNLLNLLNLQKKMVFTIMKDINLLKPS